MPPSPEPPPDATVAVMAELLRLLECAHALLEGLLGQARPPVLRLPAEGLALRRIEREALQQALDQCHGVQNAAAALLHITPRVFNYKMRSHRIRRPVDTRRALRLAKHGK